MHILLLILVPVVWLGCTFLSCQVILTLQEKVSAAEALIMLVNGPLGLVATVIFRILIKLDETVVFRKGDLAKLKKALPIKK